MAISAFKMGNLVMCSPAMFANNELRGKVLILLFFQQTRKMN